ncbi:MAG: SH3 domain-containing protein [Leeuwenhoekiella sp.]
MKKLVQLCIFLLFSGFLALAQNSETFFEQGNKLYAQENYGDALAQYQKILDAGEESAELYFNMANAHYKLSNIAPSVYYYEKALQLNPGNKQIKDNLAFAQNMTIDAITPMPKNILSRWYSGILNAFSIDGWAWIAVITLTLFTLLFLFYYFRGSTRSKRLLFIGSVTALFVGCLAIFMAFQSQQQMKNTIYGIVFAPEAEVRNAPKMNGEAVFTLHEGTKLKVLENQEDWKRIRIADGTEGWIIADDIRNLQ